MAPAPARPPTSHDHVWLVALVVAGPFPDAESFRCGAWRPGSCQRLQRGLQATMRIIPRAAVSAGHSSTSTGCRCTRRVTRPRTNACWGPVLWKWAVSRLRAKTGHAAHRMLTPPGLATNKHPVVYSALCLLASIDQRGIPGRGYWASEERHPRVVGSFTLPEEFGQ
jgi:hypothetical protein